MILVYSLQGPICRFLCIDVTSAWSQSIGSLHLLNNCWKMCVIIGAISSAVSFRILDGSSSGSVALFGIRPFS